MRYSRWRNFAKAERWLPSLISEYPFEEVIDAIQYVAIKRARGKIGQVVTGLKIIATAESPEWVATFYEFQTEVPGVERTDASEWFSVVDGKIKESYLVYDASEWRKLYAQMS